MLHYIYHSHYLRNSGKDALGYGVIDPNPLNVEKACISL